MRTLNELYNSSNSVTRKKYIQLPKRKKNTSCKNSYIKAITIVNYLPVELKTIENEYSRKIKLKMWIAPNYKNLCLP